MRQEALSTAVLSLGLCLVLHAQAQSIPPGMAARQISRHESRSDQKGELKAQRKTAPEGNPACVVTNPNTSSATYSYRWYFPVWGPSCTEKAIENFFNVESTATFVNTGRFLYNPDQTTGQASSDLVTATFPLGFQAIVAGTATTGTPQTTVSATNGSTTTTSSQTDPVAAAVAKLESGGDFNVRFMVPLLSNITGGYSLLGFASPSVGFTLSSVNSTTSGSGASATQSAVTEASQSYFNIPFELQWQTASYDSVASIFFDAKPGYQIVSPTFAKSIGLKNNDFFLGQFSAGIEFSNSFQLGVQYFLGPSQVYTLTSPSGTSTPTTTHIGGLHVVVTFSPPKKSS